MRKIISPILILLLSGFIVYDNQDYILDNAKFVLKDPAEKILNANVPERDTIETFYTQAYGTIILFAGLEDDYGFRHILARHTDNYFINYDNKNNNTLFPRYVSGKDIILGIKEFYDNCVDVEAYNRRFDKNEVYLGYTTIQDKRIKCLLVVRKENNEIITFYPFKRRRELEILEEIRAKEIEKEIERNFHFD
jgi:hypothetical protein